ncbi:MAG: Polyketide cyclase / dehydrase and lipid transport, partial [Marmoricola sp.]|nr:Polyketide cyclase / dehydrase and lipid transport [Marmoricola sp.]
RARIASVQATIPYTLTVTYDDGEGGATKVTWHQEVQSLKGFLKFADPMVVKLYSRDARSNLVKAKAILES